MAGSVDIRVNLNEENARIRQEIRRTIIALTLKLERTVKEDMLSGQRLNVQSGRLRGSIVSKVNDNSSTEIEGVVTAGGAHVKYALIHEFGLTAPLAIKQHLRQMTHAFGRPITPRAVTVQAHTRNVQFPEKRFMRDSLIEVAKIVPQNIEQAIQRGING